MIRPEHPFDIRPDLRKAASTKAASVIRPIQLVFMDMMNKILELVVFSQDLLVTQYEKP
jgi:hypothetical protein